MEALSSVENVVISDMITWKDFSRSADDLETLNSEHHNLGCKLVQQSNCYSVSSVDDSMICTVTISTERTIWNSFWKITEALMI